MNDTPTHVIPESVAVRRNAPRRRRENVLVRLDAEWRSLARRLTTARRIASWGLGADVVTLDDALIATGWRQRPARVGGRSTSLASAREATGVETSELDTTDPGDPLTPLEVTPGDATVRHLLRVAPTDELAARVLLQRLLPGLCSAARRWRRRAVDGWEPIDELVATAWTVIRTFPVETRPAHLVANLLRDTEYLAYRKQRRRLLETAPAGLPDRWGWPGDPRGSSPIPGDETLDDDALLELARMVARVEAMRDAVLDDDDRVVLRLLAAGMSLAEAAEEMGCTSRTVQNHRLRLVHRLRAALAA